MKQLDLRYDPPVEFDVDGHIGKYKDRHTDRELDIRYIGKAAKQVDGTWRCLADINGFLCVVEAKLTFPTT